MTGASAAGGFGGILETSLYHAGSQADEVERFYVELLGSRAGAVKSSSGSPSLPRYQLWHPVTQTVCGIAAFMSALKRAVASGVGEAAEIRPARSCSTHHMM